MKKIIIWLLTIFIIIGLILQTIQLGCNALGVYRDRFGDDDLGFGVLLSSLFFILIFSFYWACNKNLNWLVTLLYGLMAVNILWFISWFGFIDAHGYQDDIIIFINIVLAVPAFFIGLAYSKIVRRFTHKFFKEFPVYLGLFLILSYYYLLFVSLLSSPYLNNSSSPYTMYFCY